MKTSGNKFYRVEYVASVIESDILLLPLTAKNIIRKAIEERLMIDPLSFGNPLRYNLKGYRRLRVGDYRIVYRIDEKTHKVIIYAIKHRKDVYEDIC